MEPTSIYDDITAAYELAERIKDGLRTLAPSTRKELLEFTRSFIGFTPEQQRLVLACLTDVVREDDRTAEGSTQGN